MSGSALAALPQTRQSINNRKVTFHSSGGPEVQVKVLVDPVLGAGFVPASPMGALLSPPEETSGGRDRKTQGPG